MEQLPPRAFETMLIDLLNLERELHYPLEGESMLPTLPPGSLLTIKPLIGSPAVGDILVFSRSDQLVAHRLIRVVVGFNHTRWIVTQGDNCVRPDPAQQFDCVIGYVVSATYHGRVIWPVANQSIRRWRWIVRAYLLAAKRRARRLTQRRRL